MYQLAMIGKSEGSGDWMSILEKAANSGSADAQYDLYRSSGDNQWLKKAANNGNAKAIYDLSKITDNRQEKLALLVIAASMGHTIAKMEAGNLKRQIEKEQEKLGMEEEARLQAEQMKAVEEGSLLPSFDFIQKNIPILNISATYPKTINYPVDKILSLCKEDVLAYTERWNMDNLDKAFYMKSDDYKVDLGSLKEEKSKLYAYIYDLKNDSYSNNKQFWVDFDVDGITFRCYNIKNETNLVGYAHIGIYQIAFPVQPDVTNNGYNYFFSCDDLSTLKKVKDNLGHITFVILFRPAFAKEVQDNFGSYTKEVAFVNPVAMYILDKNSGEVVMDLSQYIREIASEQGYKSEIALIENVNKKKKEQYANWERDYKERQAKKKYHSTPKQERCFICGGSGEVTINGFVGEGPTRRCTNCYGKGYTLEHYY